VKINQELAPLRVELRNGQRVEIITASHTKPNPLWLNFVTTAKARSHIRHFLKTVNFDESVQLGERLLNQALATFQSSLTEIPESRWPRVLRDANAISRADVMSDIGLGKRHAVVIARQLLAMREAAPGERSVKGTVIIHGTEGMAVQFSKCCHPIPGDKIVGLMSKGQGVAIHTHDCGVYTKAQHDPERVLTVAWDNENHRPHEVAIKVLVANERGVLAQVAAAIAEAESNIQNVAVDPHDGGKYASMNFTVQVVNRLHLARIMRQLRGIPEVSRITRVRH
jgi:GTP pyrophosphokinase